MHRNLKNRLLIIANLAIENIINEPTLGLVALAKYHIIVTFLFTFSRKYCLLTARIPRTLGLMKFMIQLIFPVEPVFNKQDFVSSSFFRIFGIQEPISQP